MQTRDSHLPFTYLCFNVWKFWHQTHSNNGPPFSSHTCHFGHLKGLIPIGGGKMLCHLGTQNCIRTLNINTFRCKAKKQNNPKNKTNLQAYLVSFLQPVTNSSGRGLDFDFVGGNHLGPKCLGQHELYHTCITVSVTDGASASLCSQYHF